MAAENFEAVIAANIRDFQRAMREVDQQIRDAAMGADADIGADTASFLSEMAVVDAILSDLAQEHNIVLDAEISAFQAEMREADRLLDDVSSGAIADIGAHTADFLAAMQSVNQHLHTTEAGADADIGANIIAFNAAMQQVQSQMLAAQAGADATITADISDFLADMAIIEVQLADLASDHDIDIDVDLDDDAEFETLWARIRRLSRERIVIPVRAAWSNYQQVMGMMATFNRNMSEIMGMTAGGIKIMISPAIIPILATIIGLLGQMGPLLGTVGGSAFALGSAFATAGIGAAAFGAIAVTNLKDVFGASSDLKKLQEELNDTTDLKERAKIMQEMNAIQSSLTAEQTKALTAMNQLKDTWSGIAKGLEAKTIDIFTNSLGIFKSVLESLTPMFGSVMDAAGRLTDSLSKSVESESMKAFFDYLNTSAGPMLETITKSFGNFMKGFLSMMTAFGPLATETSNGFLKMSEGFASWTAGLGESKKFQAFVDYVSENMPKLRSTFGDAILGIANTFAAFAPSSAGMMTSLQDMMARFKEWSTTLSENQGFQNFINYVKENGPRVAELIGNIVTNIVAFAVAFAPVGATLLDMINSFLSWTAAMMENHPVIGKIMAAVVVFGGAMMAALPHVVGLITVIQALNAPLVASTAKMVANSAIWVAKWLWMGVQSLLHAAKMAAAWFIALGPIGWVTGAIIGLAVLIIANWDKISEWTSKVWTAVSKFVSDAVTAIMGYVEKNFPAIFKVISQYMESAKEIISTVWDYVKGTFTNVLKFLKSLVKGDFEGMKNAISDQMKLAKETIEKIWNAVKSFYGTVLSAIWKVVSGKFTEIVTNIRDKMNETKTNIMNKWEEAKTETATKLASLVRSVLTFFKDVVSTVKEKMTDAVTTVGEKVGEMPGKVLDYVSDMVSAGGDLISGVIKGITGKIGEGLDAIGGFASSLLARFKRDTDTHSPSRAFEDVSKWFAPGVVKGIDKTSYLALNSVSDFALGLTNAFNPELAMPLMDMKMSPLDTTGQVESLKRQIKQELSVDMSVNHKGGSSSEGETNGGGMFSGAVFHVRNEEDIEKLARRLGAYAKQKGRGVFV